MAPRLNHAVAMRALACLALVATLGGCGIRSKSDAYVLSATAVAIGSIAMIGVASTQSCRDSSCIGNTDAGGVIGALVGVTFIGGGVVGAGMTALRDLRTTESACSFPGTDVGCQVAGTSTSHGRSAVR